MIKQFFFLLFVLTSLSISSCGDDEIDSDTQFIFGSFNGFCVGNCAHLFFYNGNEVFRDDMDRFDLENLAFSNIAEEEIVAIAEKILSDFPSILDESFEERYGCPGCIDQGTLFLQKREGTNIRSWYLDPQIKEDWPKELAEFVTLMNQELSRIIIY